MSEIPVPRPSAQRMRANLSGLSEEEKVARRREQSRARTRKYHLNHCNDPEYRAKRAKASLNHYHSHKYSKNVNAPMLALEPVPAAILTLSHRAPSLQPSLHIPSAQPSPHIPPPQPSPSTPSSPLPLSSLPLPQSTSLSPLSPFNLIDNVRGVQLPATNETVVWRNGYHTVLPHWHHDASFVTLLSTAPAAGPESPNFLFLEKSMPSSDLRQHIREGLTRGKMVVIRDCQDVSNFTFNEEGLRNEFNLFSNTRVDIHDLYKRAEDFSYPYVKGTVHDMLKALYDPAQSQYVLTCCNAQQGLPSGLQTLDDGLTIGWNQTFVDFPVSNQLVHPDSLVRGWALLHCAGVTTYPHHNTNGANTWILGYSGVKLWVVINPKPGKPNLTRSEWRKLVVDLTSFDKYSDENCVAINDICDLEVLDIRPGDLVFQPAGQLHAVYTPTASFTVGGHFFQYNTLHLTELSRHVDNLYGVCATNLEHGHVLDTLNRMALALPRNWEFITIGKRAFVALAAMLHNPAAYECDNPMINGQREHHTPYASFTIVGKQIIDAGLRVLGLKPSDLTHHLGLGDRFDPGEPVNFGDAFKPWQQFKETDEWTDKKIIETEHKERTLTQRKSQAPTTPARQSERIREQQAVTSTSTSTSTSANRWTRDKHQTPYNPRQPRTVQHNVERSPLVIRVPPLQHLHAHGLGNGSKGWRDVLVDGGDQSSDLGSLED